MKKMTKFAMMLASLLVLTGCGKTTASSPAASDTKASDKESSTVSVDYSTYTYSQFAKEDNSKKTISYQMSNSTTIEGPMGVKADYLLNLYGDGTAALYQAGLWTSEGNDDAHWFDQAHYIAYAFFGLWKNADNNIMVRLLGDNADSKKTVTMDGAVESWVTVVPSDRDNEDKMGETLELDFATTGDKAYQFVTDDHHYIPMGTVDKFMGAILQSEEGDEHAQKMTLTLSTTVTYASLTDWYNWYTENGTATFPAASSGRGM